MSSILFLTSPQSAWGLVNQYQLFLILPFLDCYIPANFIDFIDGLQVALFEMSMLGSLPLPELEGFIKDLDYPHPYKEFTKNGVESGSFIVTQTQLIKLILIIAALHVVFIVGFIFLYKYKC